MTVTVYDVHLLPSLLCLLHHCRQIFTSACLEPSLLQIDVLLCRMVDAPDIRIDQQALQIFLLSSAATRLAAAELMMPHIQSFVISLNTTENPVAVELFVQKKLQLVLEAVTDTQNAALCTEIWDSLTCSDEAGEKHFSSPLYA